jgi:hypothetical protein
MFSFTPRPLYPREKDHPYSLDKETCGSQSCSGRCGEEKILDRAGTRTPTPCLCPVTHSIGAVGRSRVAVSEARGQFGYPDERERSSLEVVTRKLMKTLQTEKTEVCAVVIC